MRNPGLLLSGTLLAACSTAPAVPQIPERGADPRYICKSDRLSDFIGHRATADLGAQMLAAANARTLRWVPFGGAVTMDFSPSRLTVQLDRQGRVESANCG